MNSRQAFGTLLGDVEAALEESQSRRKTATQRGDFEAMGVEHDRQKNLVSTRQQLEVLQELWLGLVGKRKPANKRKQARRTTSRRKRLPRGAKTQQQAFVVPILRVLEELGGSGAASKVLDRVGRLMSGTLNEFDLSALKTGAARWRNTAQWARQDMKQEGLLADDSPRGVWEITERGRAYLQEHAEDLARRRSAVGASEATRLEVLGREREPKANASQLIGQHFKKRPHLRPLFDLIRRKVEDTCPNAFCYANPKWINFKHHTIFLVGEVRKDHIELGLALGADFDHDRYARLEKRTSRGGRGGWLGWQPKFSGAVRVYHADQVDQEFCDLVRIAYERS